MLFRLPNTIAPHLENDCREIRVVVVVAHTSTCAANCQTQWIIAGSVTGVCIWLIRSQDITDPSIRRTKQIRRIVYNCHRVEVRTSYIDKIKRSFGFSMPHLIISFPFLVRVDVDTSAPMNGNRALKGY